MRASAYVLQKEYATLVLSHLANNDPDNWIAIAEASAIPPLIKLLKAQMDRQKEYAASVLASIALDRDNQILIRRERGIAPLVDLTRLGSKRQKENAALARGEAVD